MDSDSPFRAFTIISQCGRRREKNQDRAAGSSRERGCRR